MRSRSHPADFFALFPGDDSFVASVAGAKTAAAAAASASAFASSSALFE